MSGTGIRMTEEVRSRLSNARTAPTVPEAAVIRRKSLFGRQLGGDAPRLVAGD